MAIDPVDLLAAQNKSLDALNETLVRIATAIEVLAAVGRAPLMNMGDVGMETRPPPNAVIHARAPWRKT